ncbi:hypothetical protein JYP46_01430 [Nitratireductor aquimarinus]|uniref:hypothetical protein n=1 Tax=Alphaproteobacteria TaxID=28211 RepID=UPI0019D40A18|nr:MULTISPECIES: hypothetical protein [Alphaproteobacteria]MBN7755472.1 hypothetical protein [Nitratireductor aquimarinus]MBY5998227.1 hypothetical protein [Tritonibacter mobilis]MBY6020255.1 hypothetical protein [Nitratireductor sp. DP7N14-4]
MACSKEAMESNQIAKAYYAGATAEEISEQYNRSIKYVMEQVRKYDRQQKRVRQQIAARRAREPLRASGQYRDLTGMLMGDPVVGRDALSRKEAA